MEKRIVKEQPLYSFYGCCAGESFGDEFTIELFKEDLEKAEIGDEWTCCDQDRYPNRTREWTVTAKVVFRDEKNIYLHCYDDDDKDYDELVAIELH